MIARVTLSQHRKQREGKRSASQVSVRVFIGRVQVGQRLLDKGVVYDGLSRQEFRTTTGFQTGIT
jgi:hypothetical protein